MNFKSPAAGCQWPVARRNRVARKTFNFQPSTFNPQRAFTLIELLVVISILGILAALTVPALKDLGKSNAQISATRQLLDDIGRARQLAISQHTTVYMVFVPTNFWGGLSGTNLNSVVTTNLVDKQLTGYTFASLRSVGDQPGQGVSRYLSEWKSLPEGTYIAPQKFAWSGTPFQIPSWQNQYGRPAITNFTRFALPFPTEGAPSVYLPCLAFDYQGRLVSEPGAITDAYIPLVQGSVSYGLDANKQLTLTPLTASDIAENPAGNSGIGNNNLSYNVIHIDALTGRARLEKYKMP
jgi:prepilin-type N-terminal cleavage/methylation domain-containing protein